MIEVGLDFILEVELAEAGNTGCTTDVPDAKRGTLVVEVSIEVADVVIADVSMIAIVGVDAPA